jgi:predicted nucleotidyltransferase
MRPPPLTASEVALLHTVFKRHPEISQVRLFGSRAKGAHNVHSDIDLALWGEVDALRAESIAAELDELPLPYRYDVQRFEAIALGSLRDHIERRGVLIYSRAVSNAQHAEEFDREARLADLIDGRLDFWELARDISRENLLALVDLGLRQGEGSYNKLAEIFRISKADYRRLMDFLRRRDCLLDGRPYRRVGT